ncbi:MAG: hypothetical protein ACP5JD_02290 [Candidatus Bipolaricaulaceae bacterium]
MKRILALLLALGGLGILAFGETCAPCASPATEPPCYTAFWQGEDICFELVVPWYFYCSCCYPKPMVTGWRVATLDGNVVYQETFPSPVAPSKWVWKQVDTNGNPAAPGYYKIIISTTTGEYENTIKIVARPECQPCCCFPFFFFGCWGAVSKPCGISWCSPYVKVYRCPACEPSCWGPCGVTIYLGVKEP